MERGSHRIPIIKECLEELKQYEGREKPIDHNIYRLIRNMAKYIIEQEEGLPGPPLQGIIDELKRRESICDWQINDPYPSMYEICKRCEERRGMKPEDILPELNIPKLTQPMKGCTVNQEDLKNCTLPLKEIEKQVISGCLRLTEETTPQEDKQIKNEILKEIFKQELSGLNTMLTCPDGMQSVKLLNGFYTLPGMEPPCEAFSSGFTESIRRTLQEIRKLKSAYKVVILRDPPFWNGTYVRCRFYVDTGKFK